MRRLIVLLSLLVAALWLTATVASAGAATASPRAPHIVCPIQDPQVPNPHLVPCCPLPPSAGGANPQPICCQATSPCCNTACCPTTCCTSGTCCTPALCGPGSLTIAASPNPSKAGQKIVIKGAVVGNAVSGAQIVLWRERAGQSSFQQMAQTTTDSSGAYTFTLPGGTVMADQAYYASSSAARSATIHQLVEAAVGLTPSARSARVGQAVVLRGHVTPSHAGQTVLIERKHGSAWGVLARARLGRGSSYTLSHRFTQRGKAELRVVLRADTRNTQSLSRTVTITVT